MEEQIKAIERLVQQAYGVGGDTRAEANRVLLLFQSSREAWQIAPRLFGSAIEVQFFAAHTLYTKIRTEWEQLSDDEKISVRGVILQLLRHLLTQGNRLVVSRLALALAAIALRSVLRNQWPNLMSDIISLNSLDTTGELVSEILMQIPEELDSIAISETRKEDLCMKLREDAEKIIGHIRWVMQQPQGAKSKALNALRSWIRLNPPPELVFSNEMFGLLFSTLATADLFPSTIDVLIELLAQPMDLLKLRGSLQAVLQLKPMYEQATKGNGNVTICSGLCRLVSSLGEHNSDLIITMKEPEGKGLVAFALECTRHPSIISVALHSLSFWERLEKDLYEGKPEQVAEFVPAYGALLQILFDQCRYLKASEDDPEQFKEFRKAVMDSLQSCYALLGVKYFAFLWQVLQSSQNSTVWTGVESTLYLVRAVASVVSSQIKRGNFNPEASLLIKQILAYFIRYANENKNMDPRLLKTGLVMISEYAPWMKTDPELLKAVLQFVCYQLTLPSPCSAAASAFKRICIESKETVLPQLGEVVKLWTSTEALHKLKEANRVFVIEGIMSVCQNVNPHEIATLLSLLSAPTSARIKALMQSTQIKTDLSPVLVSELRVINSIFKSLANIKSAPADAALPMLRDLWPCLELLAKSGLGNEEVMRALCDCFISLLLSTKQGSIELLSPLVTAVVQGFGQTHFGCFLDVLSMIIRAHYETFGSSTEVAEKLGTILQAVAQATFGFLQKDVNAHPDVVCAYFEMVNQALRCAPQSVAQLLTTSFSLALISLNFADRNTSRAVVSFLNTLALTRSADALFLGAADQLLTSLINSMVNTINQNLIHYQAELLFNLINGVFAHDEAARNCVIRCVTSITSPFLNDSDKQRLLELLWKIKSKRRFTAMMADLGHVLAGEMTADVLVSYEM